MFFNLASKSAFVIKLVISGILFSTAVNAEAVAKPLTSGILFSTAVNFLLLAKPLISLSLITLITLSVYCFCSVIKQLTLDFLANPLISGIFFSTLSILSSRALVSVVNLVLVTKPEVSIASTLFFNVLCEVFLTTSFLTTLLNLARSLGTVFNLSVSILSTSVFKAAKLVFNAYLLIST